MKLANVGFRDIVDSMPREKLRSDPLWSRVVLRPLSFLLTYPLAKIGVRANHVSYASVLIVFAGFFLMTRPGRAPMIAGSILYNLFALLDCVDGNLARIAGKPNRYGEWADSLGGYTASYTAVLAMGVAAGGSVDLVVVASLGAGANLLARLVHHKFTLLGSGVDEVPRISVPRVLEANLGITGLMMPLMLMSVCKGWMSYLAIFYASFYVLSCIGLVVRLIVKIERCTSGTSLG